MPQVRVERAAGKAMMFEAVIDYLSGGTDDQLDLVKKRMAAYFDNAATVSPSLTSVKMLRYQAPRLICCLPGDLRPIVDSYYRAKKHEYLMEELKRVHTMLGKGASLSSNQKAMMAEKQKFLNDIRTESMTGLIPALPNAHREL